MHQWLFFEQNSLEPNVGTVRFWHLTGRASRYPETFRLRMERGHEVLAALERHLRGRTFLVGEHPTVADIALYAYTHVAPEGGFGLERHPAVSAWLERVKSRPGHIGALAPYTANAHVLTAPAA